MKYKEIQLIPIEKTRFSQEEKRIFSLMEMIFSPYKNDIKEAKSAIQRWYKEDRSGMYFYIQMREKIIGITGYYVINETEGLFGLRHHGVLIKGIGRDSLDLLIEEVLEKYNNTKKIIELIPKNRSDLVPIFQNWGFERTPINPDWLKVQGY